MSLILGLDIGIQGAIAFLDASTRELLGIEDMPIDQMTVGKHTRNRISAIRLVSMLHGAEGHAFLERPAGHPMRGRDKSTGAIVMRRVSAMGMLAFGESYGIAYTACIAAGMQVTEVRPGSWKREMSVSGDKDEARRRASELFPVFASSFARKKDDGRAESALIALWGSRR